MNDALAKQLEDAGFPKQGGTNAPTLHDLIAACGDHFWSLRRTPDHKWIATGRIAAAKGQIPYYESAPYDEPDVAVAEIFLSVQSHAHE